MGLGISFFTLPVFQWYPALSTMFLLKSYISPALTLSLLAFPAIAAKPDTPPHVFDQLGDKQAGSFIPNIFTNSESNIFAVPELLQLELEGLGQVQLHIEESLNEFDRQVLNGTLLKDGEEVPFSEVVLVEAKHDAVMGSIETPDGNWLLMPQYHGPNGHTQYLIKRHDKEIDDELLHDEHDQTQLPEINGLVPEQLIQAAPDVDQNGDTVIDVFMGFSERAIPYVQDMEAYAVMQIATVNNALKNSKIDNIRIRLVGIGTTHHHRGMDWTQLNDLENWFAEDIAKYSPDIVTGYFTLDDSYPNQAGGWAFVGGYQNINNVTQPHAFRHELGHNIGGSHCNDNAGYNFGFNNGMTKTHQCGNNINYYSNPDVTDMYGLAIGDASSANMARVWRENAASHSSRRPALVPFENEIRVKAVDKPNINISANGWDYTDFEVPESSSRMIVTLNEGSLTRGGKHKLYVQKGENPTANGFHTMSKEGGNSLSLAVNDMSAGTWSVGIKNESSNSNDLILSVYLFAENGEQLSLDGQDNNQDDNQDSDQENNQDDQTVQLAELSSPLMGTFIDSSSFNFSSDSQEYLWLFVGSSKGAADIYDGDMNNSQATVNNIELNGAPLYVTLWTYINGDWQAKHYEFSRILQDSNTDMDDSNSDDSDNSDGNDADNSNDNESNNGTNTGVVLNQAPVVIIKAPSQVQAAETVLLDGSGSYDINGDKLIYIWRQESGPSVHLQNKDLAIASFEAPVVGSDTQVTFSLTVFDGKELNKDQVIVRLLAEENTNETSTESDKQGGGAIYWFSLLLLLPLMGRRQDKSNKD